MSRLYDTYREFLNEVEVEEVEEETDPYYLDLRAASEVPHSFLPVDTDWEDDASEDGIDIDTGWGYIEVGEK